MSSSVDSRIVTMKFDNATFEKNARTTMSTMDKLKGALSFSGVKTGLSGIASTLGKFNPLNMFSKSQKGIQDLQTSANKFTTGSMTGQVTHVSKSFLAMSTVAITAIASIASKAIQVGSRLGTSLVRPLMDGFKEYETNLNSIQTVLANTRDQGSTLKDVNKSLAELNAYSDKTIYNFSEMARNIGTFTAAGVDLKTSVASIKGIANLAATSGSSSEQASTAMYQLSQAISAGKVGLQDWNSVVNAGMGGAVFQKALARTAENMGTVGKTAIKVDKETGKLTVSGKSFRESIMSKPGEKSWLTSDVLVNTLKQFSGDMTVAQLKAQGFSDTQIKAIREQAKTGVEAATKVKTMSQLLGTLSEASGSGWAQTWQIIFGNFNEAKKTFTSVSDVLGGMIKKSANARNNMLKDWKKMGGRTVLIEAISNAFKALMSFLKPIHKAFREIFPKSTGKDLYEMTVALRNFTEGLILGKDSSQGLYKTFKGLFAIVDIGLTVFKAIVGYILGFFGLLSGGNGSVLTLTGSVGDLLVQLDDWLVKGNKITDFFTAIEKGRAAVMEPLVHTIGLVLKAFAALVTGDTEGFINKLKEAFGSLGGVVDGVKTVFNNLVGYVKTLAGKIGLGSIFDFGDALPKLKAGIDQAKNAVLSFFDVGPAFSKVSSGVDNVSTAFKGTTRLASSVGISWENVLSVFEKVKDFLAPVLDVVKQIFAGFGNKVKDFVANMGIEDGLAVVNTGFFIALYIMFRSFLKKMSGVLTSVTEMFDGVTGVLKQVSANLKVMQQDVKANIILKIAAALLLLSVALLVLSKIKAKDLAKALGAVAGLLILVVKALDKLDKEGGKISGGVRITLLAAGLLLLSTAIVALSGAVAILGHMKTKTLIKGMLAVAAMLTMVTTMTAILSKTGGGAAIIGASIGLTVLAAAMVAIAGAIKLFASIKTGTIVEGVAKMAGVLVALTLALALFRPIGPESALALFIVANALVVLSGALKLLGNLSGGELLKSILTLAIVLPILAAAMYLMTGTLGGSAAMLVMSAALIVLAAALKALGSLDLWTIGKALLAIAGTFLVLGLAAVILTPVVPIILALAAAILLLGIATVAVGGGLLLLSAGLAGLAASGAAGMAVLTAGIIGFAELLPLLFHQLGLGFIAFAKVLSTAGPAMVKAITVVLLAIIKSVIRVAPQFGKALIVMMKTGLKVIRSVAPDFIKTGLSLLLSFLKGVRDNIGRIVKTVSQIVRNFLTELGKQLPKLTDAGIRFIVRFINGLAKGITKHRDEINRAGWNLAVAIVSGISNGLGKLGHYAVAAARNLAAKALKGMFDVFDSHSPSRETHKLGMYAAQGLANGLDAHESLASKSASGLAATALDTMKSVLSGVGDILGDDVDMSPTITPVLDLSNVKAQANGLGGLLDGNAVSASVSYNQAAEIAANRRASQEAVDASSSEPTVKEISFNQYNTSPVALSPTKIYRSTKSQLALAKEELKV